VSIAEPLAIGSISLRLYPHDVPAREQLDLIRRQARLAVEAGHDGVMVSEHHADFPGYLPNPMQIAGFLLPAMPRGWAAACPLLLPMQPYALVAEQLAWLDAAYPGRVGAGFASGALPVDFELAEVPFDEIRERFKAALPKVVAALRGEDPTPLGQDRAVRATAQRALPMVAAAQSPAAVRRAARLGIGILYDSLQTIDVTRRLSDIYDEAGGPGPKILIRRVWVGDPPQANFEAQMDHYRTYAPESAMKNWGDGTNLVHGRTGEEAAEALAEALREGRCDTVNVRVHVKGLSPEQVEAQIAHHAETFLPHLRTTWASEVRAP
jgi:alkanesulfonate monooxygenase SsuD/methylene tetrahydromethanopterin reductase-like flavin-dependent oxidoreductase (luciferase family)